MVLQGLWQALEGSGLGQAIAAGTWEFPTIETVHVIAIVTVLGSILVVDLRLLGLASKESAVTRLSHDTLPWTWGAFAVAVVSGVLLFVSKATTYMVNPFFIWKMILMLLAGINMGVFHLITWRNIDQWDAAAEVPLSVKIAGGTSLTFWVVIVFVARAIGFTLDKYSS
jgi:hypothetical protein